jgi:hypothetical protein
MTELSGYVIMQTLDKLLGDFMPCPSADTLYFPVPR